MCGQLCPGLAAEAVVSSCGAHCLGDRVVCGVEIAVFGMEFAAGPPARCGPSTCCATKLSKGQQSKVVSANVTSGPKAATMIPPSAGPTLRTVLNPNLSSVTAAGSWRRSSISPIEARQAGSLSAMPQPSRKLNARIIHGLVTPRAIKDRQHGGGGHHKAATDDHDHAAAIIVGNGANEHCSERTPARSTRPGPAQPECPSWRPWP